MFFELHIRGDDVKFCEEFLKVMGAEGMCELLCHSRWEADDAFNLFLNSRWEDRERLKEAKKEKTRELWEFLKSRLVDFTFSEPDRISIYQKH